MPKISLNNTEGLSVTVRQWLDRFPADIICALQIWYEGLNGYGVPQEADLEALNAVLHGFEDWQSVGDIRYEKYGMQYSFKRK